MIDYRLLDALAAVVELGGFERAANRLCITQSAVSHRIKQLEGVAGQPVLVRTVPPIATPTGQRLLNHLQQVQQMEASLGLDVTNVTTIRLAVNADSLATWLPQALLMPDYPKICFDFVVEDQSVGLKRMKKGDVMACLCASSKAINGTKIQALGALRYRAVASPEFVERHGLQQGLFNRLPKAPCLVFNEDDQLQHQYLHKFCKTPPQQIHMCPSSEGFLRAVVEGLGFGLLPELQMQNYLQSGLLIDLTPDYYVETPLYWHYWQTESPILKQMRTQIIDVAAKKLYPHN